MKNIYQLFNISPNSSLKNILNAYCKLCIKNPPMIFNYTSALSILIHPIKRMIYDIQLYKINGLIALENYHIYEELQEMDEFELANIISWLEDFKNYFYDLKYFTNDTKIIKKIEEWYDTIDSIIENLKNRMESFYFI